MASDGEGHQVRPGGDIEAEVPEVPSMQQHPILTAHDGGREDSRDTDAYRLLAEAAETALKTLPVSAACELALLRVSRLARCAGQLPGQGPRPARVQQLG